MTDQQTKNRRIHKLMGRGCWHDVTPYVNPEDGSYTGIYRCIKCPEHVNDPLPDYYSDENPRHAREALAFAVEQKGAEVVNGVLARIIKHQWASVVADPATQRGRTYNEFVEVALAPAIVLCEVFLGVMTDA